MAYLSHLFDFGAALPDERAALAGWHNEPQGDGRLAGGWTVTHRIDYVLKQTDHNSLQE